VAPLINEGTDLALRAGSSGGQTIVQSSSPLTRLNYFDGMLVRADRLRQEQDYVRQLVQYANQGLGTGIVYGIDTTLDKQGRLNVGAGLAMDAVGRTLVVQGNSSFDIAALIDATRRTAVATRLARKSVAPVGAGADFGDCVDLTSSPGVEIGEGNSLYLICIAHAESLCGTEDVYGRLCEEACVTATDRPFVVEGVIVRALPLTLRTPLAKSRAVALDNTHLRSLVASAFFEDERHVVGSLISRAGLALDVWCLGADAASVSCVPLGVVGCAGTKTLFFDAWTARRERIEAPARRYWAWRMAMRPWDVYLAQILQFQCQLHSVLGAGPDQGAPPDPCDPQRKVLDEASAYLRQIDQSYVRHVDALAKLGTLPENLNNDDVLFRLQGGATDLARLRERIDDALKVMVGAARERLLINGGIVELPSAGYLPVTPGTVPVNTQVRRLMGEGVDLRFCVVRPDFVAHALEQAQHMERISLLVGLDDPQAKQRVDILVPNGDIITDEQPKLAGFDTQMRINKLAVVAAVANATELKAVAKVAAKKAASTTGLVTTDDPSTPLAVHGAGRSERVAGGGGAFYFAGAQESTATKEIVQLAQGIREFATGATKTRADLFKRAAGMEAMPAETVRASAPDDAMVSRYMSRASAARLGSSPTGLAEAAPAIAEGAPASVSVSATVRSDRDPYAMGVADTTGMLFEIFLTSQRHTDAGNELHVLLHVRVVGTFTATQAPVDTTSGRRLVGHFSGAVTTQTIEETTAGANESTAIDVDTILVRSGGADSGKLTATLLGTRITLVTESEWGGQPFTATAKVSLGFGSAQRAESGELVRASLAETSLVELFSATAVANADALADGNALRMLSSSAIQLIGQELDRANQGGTAFADAALRALFPPPPPPIDDLTVRPTLDWVLFQRRRVKRCAAEVVPPVSPTRRYQIYHLAAASDREVQAARAALRTPTGILRFTFQRVDTVDFAGGLPTLLSPVDLLVRDWHLVNPGNRLIYGAIATPITTDTPTLESARLSRVVQLLAAVSPVDANNPASAFETLPAVPTALAVPGTDGIIFLITEKLVVTTCQDVYRLALGDDKIPSLLKSGDLARLLKLDAAAHVASVAFNENSSNPTPDTLPLTNGWSKAGGGVPAEVYVYPKPNDASGGDANTRVTRARVISSAVGGPANTNVVSTQARTWPTDVTCPVITIVTVAPPRRIRVIAENNVAGAQLRPKPDLFELRGGTLDQASFAAVAKSLQQMLGQNQIVVADTAQLVFGSGAASDADQRLATIVQGTKAIANPAIVSQQLQTSSRPITANDHFADPNEPADDFLVLGAFIIT
jgi:hypothetical protein